MKPSSAPSHGRPVCENGRRHYFPACGLGVFFHAAGVVRRALAVALGFALVLASQAVQGQNNTCPVVTTNPVSKFPITVDGAFTDGFGLTGNLLGEWSDVTPQAFVTPLGGTLQRTCLDDPNKTSLLWVTLAPGTTTGDSTELYLMSLLSGSKPQ